MGHRPLVFRLAAIAALCLPAVWAAGSGADALAAAGRPAGGATHDAAAHAWIRAAATMAAPLVPDSGPPGATKTGQAAPAMNTAMLRANATKQSMARSFLIKMNWRAGPALTCVKRPCRTVPPAARNLRPTQRRQVTNYFCGPATVTEMLAQMHVNVRQRLAARELGTTQNGTDWSNSSGYPVPEVLNENQRINDYVAVGLPWVPTRSQLRTYESDLVADINHGRGAPLAGDAYEVPGGPHLVGHPAGSTIFHWFDIRGYQNYGATTDYEDSVHGASSIGWGVSVPAYSSLTSSAIVNIVGARGYDW
jgi:hypothetical protein